MWSAIVCNVIHTVSCSLPKLFTKGEGSSFKIHDASQRFQKLASCLACFIYFKCLFFSALSLKCIHIPKWICNLSEHRMLALNKNLCLQGPSMQLRLGLSLFLREALMSTWRINFLFILFLWFCIILCTSDYPYFCYYDCIQPVIMANESPSGRCRWSSSHFLIIVIGTKMNSERVLSLHHQR